MKERALVKKHAGKPPNEKVVGVGIFPGRKRPSLYIGNEWCARAVASFINEDAAEDFIEWLSDFVGAEKETLA